MVIVDDTVKSFDLPMERFEKILAVQDSLRRNTGPSRAERAPDFGLDTGAVLTAWRGPREPPRSLGRCKRLPSVNRQSDVRANVSRQVTGFPCRIAREAR